MSKERIRKSIFSKISVLIVFVIFIATFGFIVGFTSFPDLKNLIIKDSTTIRDPYGFKIEVIGPIYVQAQNIFFYRIVVDTKKNPGLVIQFSKDDSFGAWGPNIAQVNLEPEETYSLLITIPPLSINESITLESSGDFFVNETPTNLDQ